MNNEEELTEVSAKIYTYAAEQIMEYCGAHGSQISDYLYIASKTGAAMLGQALALIPPEDVERMKQRFLRELDEEIEHTRENP